MKMFSKEYFLYLIKSKKGLLIFEGLLNLLMLLAVGKYNIGLFLFVSIVMCYFLSCNVFSYVHSKKAIDTYFSLPISRSAMLITGIVFVTLFSSVPMLLGIVIKAFILKKIYVDAILFFVVGIAMVLVIVLFNTAMYLIGNNNVDGIVLLGAYTMLPAFVYLSGYIFLEVFVAGYDGTFLDNIIYLSPTLMYILTYTDLIENNELLQLIPIIISFVIFASASIFVLKKEFIDRKVERAESISKNLFAYPMVIAIYMSLMMLGISSNFDMSLGFFADYFGLYLVLFAAFVAAMFLFKRKFEFNWKLPVVYISVMILTLVIAVVANLTKGFGIAYSYANQTENICYQYYFYSIEDPDIEDYISEFTGIDENVWSITINAENIEGSELNLKEETLEVLKKKHIQAIDNYYKEDDYFSNGNLTFKTDCYYNGNNLYCLGYHAYYSVSNLTKEELEILLNDPAIKYGIEYYDGEYYGNTKETVTMDWY